MSDSTPLTFKRAPGSPTSKLHAKMEFSRALTFLTLTVSDLSLPKANGRTVTTINLMFSPGSNISYHSIQSIICAKLNTEEMNETSETVEENERKTTKITKTYSGKKIFKEVMLRWKDTEGRLVRLDDQEELREALREMVVDKKPAAGKERREVVVLMPDAGKDIGDGFQGIGSEYA